jgi:16S rRNA (cytosine967-C5)-methyltransferase
MVSDIRSSILQNLKRRFLESGISPHYLFEADLSKSGVSYKIPQADIILADVPCTGSGTWARTPEQHYFFNPSELKSYSDRQWAICNNVMPYLKPGGYFIYITCSVFFDENEGIKNRLAENEGITLLHSQYLDGTTIKADSMFIALFQKG